MGGTFCREGVEYLQRGSKRWVENCSPRELLVETKDTERRRTGKEHPIGEAGKVEIKKRLQNL